MVNTSTLTSGEVVYANGDFNYFNGTSLVKINTGIAAANAAIAVLKTQVTTLQTQVVALQKVLTTGPVTTPPPSSNIYPLTMTPVANPGDPVTLGQGSDQVVLLLAQSAADTVKSVIAVVLDNVAIAAPLSVSSTGANQIFTIKGSWGSNPHTIQIVNAGAGINNLVIAAVAYNFVPYVNNGPATYRQDSAHVNALSLWDNYNLPTTWTLPIAVTASPPPPPVPVLSTIAATINGVATSGSLDQLCAATPSGATLALPSGTFVGTSAVPNPCSIVGSGPATTIIDGTGLPPTYHKAGLVSLVSGVSISGMTIKNFAIAGDDGGNASSVRNNGAGIDGTLSNFKSTGNQDGLLTGGGNWTLTDCQFINNGAGNPGSGATHEMYLATDTNNVVSLTRVTASCGPLATHALKSRAKTTNATGCTFTGNANDPGSANAGSVVDIPDGGVFNCDSSIINMPAGSVNHNMVTYAEESSNNSVAGMAVKLTRCVFNDGVGSGGGIVSANSTATLDVTGSTYSGAVAPVITGWASVTGSITKA